MEKLYKLFTQHPVITTDTRDCPKGSIFFALKGASFNGNNFAMQALEHGCSYAVIDETPATDDPRLILVDDVLTTLQQLARYHRRHLQTPVIGITGTNGKTTTKELVATVLGEKYNVLYTQGNFNNHIGVPKTLLRLTPEHDLAVIEMGANHPGEIKTLVDIVEPDCGLITNVGRAHLGGFGSFEGVKKTKGELYDFLVAHKTHLFEDHKENSQDNGAQQQFPPLKVRGREGLLSIFLDSSNPHLCEMISQRGADALTIPYVKGSVIDCKPYLHFQWEGGEVMTHLIGDYNLINMMAAATVGRHFGVSDEQINHALSNYIPSNNRSQLTVTAHNRLVVDAYNANPTSMAAALNNFKAMDVPGKMVILGSMGELGDVSQEEHKKIVGMLEEYGRGEWEVWLVGEEFAKTGHPFRQFTDVEAVKAAIEAEQPSGHYILIKGSNAQKLFLLPELL